MKRLLTCAASLAIAATAAMAHGEQKKPAVEKATGRTAGHDNSDGHHGAMAVGKPGKASEATRTVRVAMDETDDGHMLFEPAALSVHQGETIRFLVTNAGESDHEFVLDDHKGMMKHKALMERFPEMEHDDPNSVRLEPGQTGEVVWTFTNAGTFMFACMIPGHFEAGMKGDVVVQKERSSALPN